MRRALLAVAVVVLLLLGVAYVRSPIDPVAWEPPAVAPLDGPYRPDTRLEQVEWWARQLPGPEAVSIEPDGGLLVGTSDGRVVRLSVGSDEVTELARTGGRPLAVARHPDGRLFICDARRGLLVLDAAGTITVVSTGEGGVPFRFVDDLAIASDGAVYFTDASARFSIEHFTDDLLEHGTTGRVLRYDAATGKTTLVAGGFNFANGLALTPDERAAIVSETGAYRLWRVPLDGSGKKELFTDSLPGFVDNVRWSPSRRGYWVAVGSPRKPAMDALAGLPWARRLVAGLPRALQPAAVRHAWVVLVDEAGRPVESFQDPRPVSYSPIAAATEGPDGYLYLGSFSREGIARFKLP